jgi:hypothetical protein
LRTSKLQTGQNNIDRLADVTQTFYQ